MSKIGSNIIDSSYYNKFWENGIWRKIEFETEKKVIPSTFGNVPSFFGHIPLVSGDGPSITVSLYFYVSIAAEYFSIEIVTFDKYKFQADIPGYGKFFTPGITHVEVSPSENCQKIFSTVEIALRIEFKGYKFLPSAFDYIRLKGLNVIQNDLSNNPLSAAFFSKCSGMKTA